MRKISIVLISLLFCLTANAQKNLAIKGKVDGLPTDRVYLYKYDLVKSAKIDSTKVVNGEFRFSTKAGVAEVYFLKFNKMPNQIFLFPEKGELVVNILFESKNDRRYLKAAEVTGSIAQNAYSIHNKYTRSVDDEYRKTNTQYNQAKKDGNESEIVRIGALMDENDKVFEQEEAKTLEANLSNTFGLYMIAGNISAYDYDKLKSILAKVSITLHQSDLYKSLNTRMAKLEKVKIGAIAPDFSMPDTSGNTISLSQFRGKVVVIDCWASWCSPCRKENPNMVKLNNAFKDKDFVLLGVSFDRKKDNWIKAIKDDNLSWTHISDLKNWDCLLNSLYLVNSIPETFIIDREGRIVARGLQGEELMATVRKVIER